MLLKGKMKCRLFLPFNGAAAFQANHLPNSLSSSWDARGLDPPLGCKPSSSCEPVGALCSGAASLSVPAPFLEQEAPSS